MLNFIILSNGSKNEGKYVNSIERVMINLDIGYEIHKFNDCNNSFINFCKDSYGTNIFILENKDTNYTNNTISLIKNEYELTKAFIIVIDKEGQESNISSSFLIDVISETNFEEHLQKDIKTVLEITEIDKNFLNIIQDKLLLRIPYNDIYYIEKELNGKKCTIVCKNKKYYVVKSLNEFQRILDSRFFRSHQSALINIEKVSVMDFENGIVQFEDNVKCNLMSRSFKKKMRKDYAKCD